MIAINLIKEVGKLRFGDVKVCLLECQSQLLLVKFAVMIPVNALEHLPQLFLSALDKSAKFCQRASVLA